MENRKPNESEDFDFWKLDEVKVNVEFWRSRRNRIVMYLIFLIIGLLLIFSAVPLGEALCRIDIFEYESRWIETVRWLGIVTSLVPGIGLVLELSKLGGRPEQEEKR